MDGNGNPTRNDAGQPAAPSTQLQIVITWDQVSGAMNVTGAIANSVIAFGMLDTAKDVIRKYIEAHQSPIVSPSGLSLVRH